MKKTRWAFLISLAVLLLLLPIFPVTGSESSLPPAVVCVPDEETAIAIANIIIKNIYEDTVSYERHRISVKYLTDSDAWMVGYSFAALKPGDVGGGPAIVIKKRTAEVTMLMIFL